MNGKGGTGKTTVASLLVANIITRKKGSVLAIDADPNSCLAENLGIKDPQTIVGICEDISKNMDKIPAGMTKERFIEMRVQEAVIENKDFDLLVMGRPEGPGCYCYVNNLLRGMLEKITSGYEIVVIDNAAGMEHISRRTAGALSELVLVSDYSITGIRSAKRIYDLAKEMGIKMLGAHLIVNKVSGSIKALEDEIENTAIDFAGTLPYYEELVSWNISGKPIFEFKSKALDDEFNKIVQNLKI